MKNILALSLIMFASIAPRNAVSFEIFDNLKRVGELGAEIDSLKKQNDEILQQIEKLKADNHAHQMTQELQSEQLSFISTIIPEKAIIDPTSKRLQQVVCKGGLFSVYCKDIKAYSTGSEVTLYIINMLSTRAIHAEIKIGYSTADKNKEYEKYKEFYKEKTEKTLEIFEPATPKLVKITLPEYKPDQVKAIEFSIKVIAQGTK